MARTQVGRSGVRLIPLVLRAFLLTAMLMTFTQAMSSATLAQGTGEIAPLAGGAFPECAWNCSANDVQIESVWLGDAAGNRIAVCPVSGAIPTAYVWVTLNNITGTERLYVSLKGNLQVGDGPVTAISPCLISPLTSGGTTSALLLSQVQNVRCTSVITLSQVVIPWVTSPEANTSCAGRPTECNPSWPSGQAWCGGPYTIDVVPEPTPTATATPTNTATATRTNTATATATRTNTPVNTPALTLAPQDDPTATPTNPLVSATPGLTTVPTAVPTATSQPQQPVLPATGTGSTAGTGSALSLAIAVAGCVAYWLRRKSVI